MAFNTPRIGLKEGCARLMGQFFSSNSKDKLMPGFLGWEAAIRDLNRTFESRVYPRFWSRTQWQKSLTQSSLPAYFCSKLERRRVSRHPIWPTPGTRSTAVLGAPIAAVIVLAIVGIG